MSPMAEGRLTLTHVILFVATCITTLTAGAFMEGVNPLESTTAMLSGLPFAGTLMSILLTHEMGHYLMSRRHGTPATLPYFIPGPPLPPLPGTFGAIIKMRPPIMDRRALLDIGSAGPLAGFMVAVAATGVGLGQSEILPSGQGIPESAVTLGDPLIFKALAWLVLGTDGGTGEILLSPVAYAGWFGFFITALNLIPVGQLDGGHISYALLGPQLHAIVSRAAIPVLIVFGFFWPGWAFWGVLLIFLGRNHPPVVLPHVDLDRKRKLIGWASITVFVLTFMPAPFAIY